MTIRCLGCGAVYDTAYGDAPLLSLPGAQFLAWRQQADSPWRVTPCPQCLGLYAENVLPVTGRSKPPWTGGPQ